MPGFCRSISEVESLGFASSESFEEPPPLSFEGFMSATTVCIVTYSVNREKHHAAGGTGPLPSCVASGTHKFCIGMSGLTNVAGLYCSGVRPIEEQSDVKGQGGGRTCVTTRPSEAALLSFFVGAQYLRKQIAPLDKKFPVTTPSLSPGLASNILNQAEWLTC